MARVTIHLDDDTATAMRDAARAAGVSASRWVADLVRARTSSRWPAEFLALEGAWAVDGPDFEEPNGEEVKREPP